MTSGVLQAQLQVTSGLTPKVFGEASQFLGGQILYQFITGRPFPIAETYPTRYDSFLAQLESLKNKQDIKEIVATMIELSRGDISSEESYETSLSLTQKLEMNRRPSPERQLRESRNDPTGAIDTLDIVDSFNNKELDRLRAIKVLEDFRDFIQPRSAPIFLSEIAQFFQDRGCHLSFKPSPIKQAVDCLAGGVFVMAVGGMTASPTITHEAMMTPVTSVLCYVGASAICLLGGSMIVEGFSLLNIKFPWGRSKKGPAAPADETRPD